MAITDFNQIVTFHEFNHVSSAPPLLGHCHFKTLFQACQHQIDTVTSAQRLALRMWCILACKKDAMAIARGMLTELVDALMVVPGSCLKSLGKKTVHSNGDMYCCTMCGDDGQYCRSSAPDTANFC
jgi:hypothetical protein